MDPPDLGREARKIASTLFVGKGLTSAGLIATSTVTTIVGAELSRRPALAGLPPTLHLAGAALAAVVWGYLMDRFGRHRGPTAGLAIGVIGAFLVGTAIRALPPGLWR